MYQSFLYNVRLRPVEESGTDHGFKISRNGWLMFCWIPAFAGMTFIILEGILKKKKTVVCPQF